MNLTKKVPLILVVTLNLILVVGCSTNAKFNRLSSDVQTLNTKVDQLSHDMNVVHSNIQTAKEDAVRANQRLDNQVTRYRK